MNRERVDYFLKELPKNNTEFEELEAILYKADEQYNNSKPDLTDSEFDALLFKAMESEFFTGDNVSVLNKVSEEENGKSKITHQYNFLSLQKANKLEDVQKFLDKFSDNKNDLWYTDGFIIQPKEDGVTTVLYSREKEVNKGELTFASRGQGERGSEANDNTDTLLPTFSDLTIAMLNNIGKIVARGESIIENTDFNNINSYGEFQNSRNLVSGTINSKSKKLAKERKVKTLFYSIENITDFNIKSEIDTIDKLISIFGKENVTFPLNIEGKLSTVDNFKDCVFSKEEIIKIISEFNEEKRATINHTIDGLVIKPNYIVNKEKIGYTSHHPKNQLAFKFKADVVSTKLKDVIWQIGKTGQLTPVAILEKVELLGVNISRASLANYQNIVKRDIKIGDMVLIQKANDVIPQVVKSIKGFRNGSELDINIPEDSYFKGKHLFSKTITEEQLLRRWEGFVGKSGLDIDAISSKTIEVLHQNNLIDLSDFSSLWNIKKEDWVAIDGLGEKSFSKFKSELENSKKTPVNKVIASLGLPMIGKTLSKELSTYFNNINDLLNADDKKVNKLLKGFSENVPGIGDKKIDAIKAYLLSDESIQQLKNLESVGFSLSNIEKEEKNNSSKLSGKTVVITGKTNLKRSELKELLESNSVKLTGTVSKKTDYLVSADKQSNSSKNKKAIELSIPIISEEELLELLK